MVVQIPPSTTNKAMLLISFCIFLIGHACFLSPTTTAHALSSPQDKNIILLAGQSNMSGRGGVVNETWNGFIPGRSRPNPSILRLNAKLEWMEAREPLHKDIDVTKTCGIGPGMPFANSVLSTVPNIGVIGLVPCAIGGTNVSEWARGTNLYNTLVSRANAALEGGGKIRALLWYQGESDTTDMADAEMYRSRLTKFFSDLRGDLKNPVLPIIQVALASGSGQFVETVREAQLGIGLDNVRTVDAKGMKLEPDRLHLTTSSQVKLGKMLADAFLQGQASFIRITNASTRLQDYSKSTMYIFISIFLVVFSFSVTC